MTDTDCTYCGSDVEAHRPVYVTERSDDRGTGDEIDGDSHDRDRVPVGQFCNYACLLAYVDEEELVYGDACAFDPRV